MLNISDPVFLANLESGATPVFGFLNPTSGTTNLSTTLTINGTPVQASLYYSASTATTTSWVPAAGETLPVVGSGDDPTISETLSPFTDGTPAARISASGKYYQGADGYSSADLGTDDFVFVAAIRCTAGGTPNYVFKREDISSSTKGWSLRRPSNSDIRFCINDGTNQVDRLISVLSGGWNIVVICVDRDQVTAAQSLRVYLQGIVFSSSSVSAVGNIDVESPLTIGAYSDGTNVGTGDVGFLGMWKGADLFAGGAANATEMDRIATEVSYKLMGVYPIYNAGGLQTAPAVRASSAYFYKDVSGEQYAYLVPNNWIRVGNTKLGGPIGLIHERTAQNICLRSTQLESATWVKTNTTIAANTLASIFDTEIFDTVNTAIATDSEYNITQVINFSTGTNRYVFSGYAKAINYNWIYTNLYDGYDGYDCYFDLSNGTVGATPGAGLVEYGIELARTSDSLYRWWIAAALPSGQAGNYTIKFGIAEADGDRVFTEAGATAAVYAGFFQVENPPFSTSNIYPTTIYPTAGAALTRANDILYYQLDTDNHPGNDLPRTIVSTTWSPELRTTISSRYFYVESTGTGSPQTSVQRTSSNVPNTQGYDELTQLQWNLTGITNVNTSETSTVRVTAETNSVKQYVNGIQDPATEDTVATVHGVNRMYVGTSSSASGITSGVTTKLLIYDEIIEPGQRGTGSDT